MSIMSNIVRKALVLWACTARAIDRLHCDRRLRQGRCIGAGGAEFCAFLRCFSGKREKRSGVDRQRLVAVNSGRLPGFHPRCARTSPDRTEAGVPESTMLAIMGHMSRAMLERYSHIRMAAKREAVKSLELPKVGPRLVSTPMSKGRQSKARMKKLKAVNC